MFIIVDSTPWRHADSIYQKLDTAYLIINHVFFSQLWWKAFVSNKKKIEVK